MAGSALKMADFGPREKGVAPFLIPGSENSGRRMSDLYCMFIIIVYFVYHSDVESGRSLRKIAEKMESKDDVPSANKPVIHPKVSQIIG